MLVLDVGARAGAVPGGEELRECTGGIDELSKLSRDSERCILLPLPEAGRSREPLECWLECCEPAEPPPLPLYFGELVECVSGIDSTPPPPEPEPMPEPTRELES